MLTEELFRADSYMKECEATVAGINDKGGILLDRTVFYPTGGGQPGDSGVLVVGNGTEIPIVTAVKGDGEENVVHVPAEVLERRNGPPITHDGLLAFHEKLERDDWMDDLLNARS